MRIIIGGVLPEGADSVVPAELTNNPGALAEKKLEPFVEIHKDVSKGDFILKSFHYEAPGRFTSSDGRESYLRTRISYLANDVEVQLGGSQESGELSYLVETNALVRIPSGIRSTSKGEFVDVWILL